MFFLSGKKEGNLLGVVDSTDGVVIIVASFGNMHPAMFLATNNTILALDESNTEVGKLIKYKNLESLASKFTLLNQYGLYRLQKEV